MRFIEIENDNFQSEILRYCTWCSSTPIPARFDENLEPPPPRGGGNHDIRLLMPTTLVKYIGKVVMKIRDTFPQHTDFTNLGAHEVPQWWAAMIPQFTTECVRYHMRLGTEYTFGATSCQPLYEDNGFTGNCGPNITDFISLIDINSITRKLMKDAVINCDRNGKLQQRCWLALLYQAVGRGGEIKHQDFTEWMWHPKYEVIDIGWTELKLLEKYAMPMVPHRHNFLNDFYHCLGSFWMVERGLFRSNDPDERAIASSLFTDLHGLNDAGVTKKLTSIIRANLPDGCPADIVSSYSSKSARRGAITELCSHRNIQALDACGRSGHATGTSLDSYLDKTYILRGLRGGKALCKFKDIDADIKVPRLECLGAHTADAVRDLIREMFVVSVIAFLPAGSLHVVLRTCAASLIMYHRSVTKEFGDQNAVVSALRNAARKAEIKDLIFPNHSSESILDKWSDIIQKDFEARNPEIAQATPNFAEMAAVMNQQSHALQQIMAMVSDMKTQLEQEEQTRLTQQRTISDLDERLARTNAKLAVFRTPPDAAASSSGAGRRRMRANDGEDDNGDAQRRRVDRPAGAAPALERVAPAMPRVELRYTAEARTVAEVSSNKGAYISLVLGALYRSGHLNQAPVWKTITPPQNLYSEVSLLKYSLELVEVVITAEERSAFTATGTTDADLMRHGAAIEKKCMKQMLLYEGLDPGVEAQIGSKKAGTYLAVGRRVRLYKTELKKLLALPAQSENPPLQDRPPRAAPGTPPGVGSIRRFLNM
jgi:hypothetical protein